jgi:hypothetical protein
MIPRDYVERLLLGAMLNRKMPVAKVTRDERKLLRRMDIQEAVRGSQ